MSSDKIQDNNDLPSELEISSPGPGLSSVAAGDVANIADSSTTPKSRTTKSTERQIKFERAQKCLENAALVTKRIKEHRKATAELLGRPFEEDDPGDTASELASNVSERTGYSIATDTSTTLSVQDALNIPGISESLANTLKQKELLMEKIKQYKEITKKPMVKKTTTTLKRTPSAYTNIEPGKLTTDSSNLQNIVNEKENAISVMQVKMKAMETTIMDLQEKIGEKDMIIDAKTKATSLMSDNLSKKEKDSMNLLEDTRQQMTKMQENFVIMEIEWKEEKTKLVKQIEERDEKIKHLEEANTILENSRFEISVESSKIIQELEEKNKEIVELQKKLDELSKTSSVTLEDSHEQEKGSIEISNMIEMSKRIELLEQINCQIRQTNKELENKLSSAETKPSVSASPKKTNQSSPLPSRKGRNAAAKSKSPWSNLSETSNVDTEKKQNKGDAAKLEMVVQSLNKEIIDKEYVISQKDECISRLENLISEKESLLQSIRNDNNKKLSNDSVETETQVTDKDLSGIEKHVQGDHKSISNINELESKLQEALKQIAHLTEEIDAANKNMIKVKSNHKIKLKQMQKTIDSFSKVSDANAEVTKLNEEVHQLTQKVAELEEEKGNLQLHLVDYDSGRLTESETYKKLMEVESLAENRLKAISSLETQKFDLVQELHLLQRKNEELEDKLADMSHLQSEHVCSEIETVQLEEQLDKLIAENKELELIKENLSLDKEQMSNLIKKLETDKLDLTNKLDNLIQENIDLTEKLEKLSAEKVSSAESIEIVESLTTQEKLEIEEYNKGVIAAKDQQEHQVEGVCEVGQHDFNETVQKYIDESIELNRKIELFTFERQEVMEKMNALNTENELLQNQILQLSGKTDKLQGEINILNNEKQHLEALNVDLNNQIEQLKHERLEIMKEASTMSKPLINIEEATENVVSEVQSDDKSSNEKSGKGAKTAKQLTKDILKLKNVIKEREAEIADCQMKILSLEEQQQKHADIIEMNETYESKLKALLEEKRMLSEELNSIKRSKVDEERRSADVNDLKQANDKLILELNTIHNEYNTTIQTRDLKITELENYLNDYEKQIYNFNNTLQIKDKELTEYVNQVTKLNDVSQKLKSTIECLEEEKAKDSNAELVKSLNKQITIYQKTLKEYEEKLSQLEEEKSKLLSIKTMLETKNVTIDKELQILQEALLENQKIGQELHLQQQKYSDDISAVNLQVKERDEEIHEIKLQLRKESIENEKLRNELSEKEKVLENESKRVEEVYVKLSELNVEKNRSSSLESKNNELMEKLKKFAVALKKKTALCSELETQLNELKKDVTIKSEELANNSKKVEDLSNLQERILILESELKDRQAKIVAQEQQNITEIYQLQEKNKELKATLAISKEDVDKMTDMLNLIKLDLRKAIEENTDLKSQVDMSNDQLIKLQKSLNNSEFITKISALEADVSERDSKISYLLNQIEIMEQNYNQMAYGQDAKLQERDLYIENLETEISKYKSRIARLEESISVMEDRRHSLESKADQLDVQLQEKYKAYNDYSNQEDELINRLAVLMDHDRVVEKQLHEIEKDNKDLQIKIQDVNEENVKLRKSISDIHTQYDIVVEKANKADSLELQINTYQENIRELENMIKRITSEHQNIIMSKKKDIEDIEVEFNTQIENTMKEKKILLEKYEKMNEHVILLEQKVNEYKTTNNDLNVNLEDLSRLNQELYERLNSVNPVSKIDYTDQYIEEINKLNSVINLKNQEIFNIGENFKQLQANNNHMAFNQQSEINALNNKIAEYSEEVTRLVEELETLKEYNAKLQKELHESEKRVDYLTEKKTLTFEMNIPKTEGMLISSTIEELSAAPLPKPLDIASIESQIVSDTTDSAAYVKKEQKKDDDKKIHQGEIVVETVDTASVETNIVPQKAYLCYKNTEEQDALETVDPFNSDDGWGFDNSGAASGQLMADFSLLNEQILDLKKSNEKLQTDFNSVNTKLLKAMKKIKELKINNDVLTNELRLSKQLSQPAFLDSTLEDELRVQVQDLNKTLEELSAKLNSENRENETLRKQNEQLGLTNTKLLNQKEKLDNEIEMWKYKFRESNDKLSSIQWESEPRQESVPVKSNIYHNKDELIQLEKENDDLQNEIDDLTEQNKELRLTLSKLSDEIICLNERYKKECSNCNKLQEIKGQLETESDRLKTEIQSHVSKLQEIQNQNIINKQLYEDNIKKCQIEFAELNSECEKLKEDLTISNEQITRLKTELSNNIEKLNSAEANHKSLEAPKDVDYKMFETLKKNCDVVQAELLDANDSKLALENERDELIKKLQTYELQLEDMKQKMQQLNDENDQLLSTVAELRNSVSTAVDQRGYEIAEMWKQHLSQRESDFGQIEKELKEQLNAAELKYEQLLDRVQSSSQEETNALVLMEQNTSLQNKLKDNEEHLVNMQKKCAELVHEMEMLRSDFDDEKTLHESKITNIQDEFEKQLAEFNAHQKDVNTYNDEIEKLQSELIFTKKENTEKDTLIEEMKRKLVDTDARISELIDKLAIKDNEIFEKTRDYTLVLSQRNEQFETVRLQLVDYEKKLEDLSHEKESELAAMRLKLHENLTYYEDKVKEHENEIMTLTESLHTKTEECLNLNKELNDLRAYLQENADKMTEMQSALETQEYEIVTLKDEIDNLQEIIKTTSKMEKRVTFASDTKPGQDESVTGDNTEDLLEPVPKAELDLALYMLHQRDVRCEELTMELTQLLEERDTLQLRLSDSIRSQEDLKMKCKLAGLDTLSMSSQETIPESASMSSEKDQPFVDVHKRQTSRSSSVSEGDPEKPRLQAKLTELRSVKHSRDVRLRNESEQREMSMRLLQRDVANLPPEAAEQLRQAHHTLSRDTQSTSTVLLNWLRGKSTPKVVHM